MKNQIEAAIRNISGGGGQAPPGPSSSALEPRVELLTEKVDELQAQIDDPGPQPQVTHTFQVLEKRGLCHYWDQVTGDTATKPFGCFDEECERQNRTLTLNAYIKEIMV